MNTLTQKDLLEIKDGVTTPVTSWPMEPCFPCIPDFVRGGVGFAGGRNGQLCLMND